METLSGELEEDREGKEERQPVGEDGLVEEEVESCEDVSPSTALQPRQPCQPRQVDYTVAGGTGVDCHLGVEEGRKAKGCQEEKQCCGQGKGTIWWLVV